MPTSTAVQSSPFERDPTHPMSALLSSHPSFKVTNDEYAAYIDIRKLPYGYGVFAATDLEPGTAVGRFEGPMVKTYEEVPVEMQAHALLFNYAKSYLNKNGNGSSVEEDWRWLNTVSHAGLFNHKCYPNLYLDHHTLQLITRIPVKKGEELGFVYNNGEPDEIWESVWDFKCECGAPHCQCMIDRYRRTDADGRLIK